MAISALSFFSGISTLSGFYRKSTNLKLCLTSSQRRAPINQDSKIHGAETLKV